MFSKLIWRSRKSIFKAPRKRVSFLYFLENNKALPKKTEDINTVLAEQLQMLLTADSETFIKILEEPKGAFIPIQVRLVLKKGTKHRFIDELLVKEANMEEEKAFFTDLLSKDKIAPQVLFTIV